MVRRSGEESDDGGSDGGDFIAVFFGCVFVSFVYVAVSGGGDRGADRVWARGQEDEEREEIQGIVRQREAEEGEEDRADQGQGRGPQVHPLAPPFQAHLILFFHSVMSLSDEVTDNISGNLGFLSCFAIRICTFCYEFLASNFLLYYHRPFLPEFFFIYTCLRIIFCEVVNLTR